MYIDPIARQTFDFAVPRFCDKNLQNVIALDLANEEHYVLTPMAVLRAIPMPFEPKQVESAVSTNTFAAQ